MIGYCPLDEVEPPRPQPVVQTQATVPPPKQDVPKRGFEDTECNYVVMFFVIGVVVLAVMDSMKK